MKNHIFILLFLLGFLSSNTAFAMANKAAYSTEQNIHNIPKHKKTSYLEKIFSLKIGERKAIRLFTLPTRYVVNTIIIAVSQLQTSIFSKKNWDSFRDFFVFSGCITVLGLVTYFFIWLELGFWLTLLIAITSLVCLFLLVTFLLLSLDILTLKC
jgi:hypothetical protein